MVLGSPDAQWGKAVVALIDTVGGYDEAAVRAGLKSTLAAYKTPKHIVVVDAVPRHASGKGDYRAGAALAAEHLG
jgi:fatty-acyl-CoA synthase